MDFRCPVLYVSISKYLHMYTSTKTRSIIQHWGIYFALTRNPSIRWRLPKIGHGLGPGACGVFGSFVIICQMTKELSTVVKQANAVDKVNALKV